MKRRYLEIDRKHHVIQLAVNCNDNGDRNSKNNNNNKAYHQRHATIAVDV